MTFGSTNPPPLEHAQFAVISRLISCLVTERILRAFYISFKQPIDDAVGLMVVLSTHTIAEDANSYRPFRSEDVFVMIPLHHSPVFRDLQTRKHGQLVGLVDPLDMIPRAYEFKVGEKDHDVYIFSIRFEIPKVDFSLRMDSFNTSLTASNHLHGTCPPANDSSGSQIPCLCGEA